MPQFIHAQNSPDETRYSVGGILYLVATPIGNLGDFSLRAVETLKQADIILCEDTRVSAFLMREYGINRPLQSLHDHNEEHRIPTLLGKLRAGQTLALSSDAGTPVISDPGFKLVRACIEEHIRVSGIPGPNAALMALTLSGFPPHPFLFAGFPSPKKQARLKEFSILHAAEQAGLSMSVIWHESPHRLSEMLSDIATVFSPKRPIAIGRELTKKFEEIRHGAAQELADYYNAQPPKGEITVVMAPSTPQQDPTTDNLDAHILAALKEMSLKDAAAFVAHSLHLPKKIVYGRTLELAQRK